jgi:hypothetical protein
LGAFAVSAQVGGLRDLLIDQRLSHPVGDLDGAR